MNPKHKVRQKDGYCLDCSAYTGWDLVEQNKKEAQIMLEDENIRFNLDILTGELL